MGYIKTWMMQRVRSEPAGMGRLTAEDFRALMPLLSGPLSPYGTCVLEMTSRLEIASPVVIFPTGDEGRRQAISPSRRAPHRTNHGAQQLT
jgi:hypothetical protein